MVKRDKSRLSGSAYHSTSGLTIRDILRQAFDHLNSKQARLEEIYMLLGEADEDAMTELMDEMGELQTQIEKSDFFLMDAKIEETAGALGLCKMRGSTA